MDRPNDLTQPLMTGYLVCGREYKDKPMFFASREALEMWVNSNPRNAFYEYIELDHESVVNMLYKHGYSTMVFRKNRT